MASPPSAESILNQEILNQLPKELFWENRYIYEWEGFWYPADLLKGMLTLQSHYEARSDDIILASSMKTGSTWLKALCASILLQPTPTKSDHEEQHVDDQLAFQNPHSIVKGLEYMVGKFNLSPQDLSAIPSPRLFHTHLPYSVLSDSIKNSDCKIVYIARNLKDTLVSSWHFFNKIFGPYPLEKACDAFCRGVHQFGPYFDHVLQYWSESLMRPNKVMFLKYEDLKRDTKEEVKRLASFLGRPFDDDDDVEKLIWRSSLERLKNLEVNNKDVPGAIISPSSFFRLGMVGDWKNYLSEEMEQGLDKITRTKFEGSGLHFDS